MEHRDPSRIAQPPESPSATVPPAPRPLPRWIAHAVARRPAPGRIALWALAAATALSLGIMVLALTSRSLIAWLGNQPPYRRIFREIELDPPAPAFLRAGSAGLIEEVRVGARWPADEPLPLDFDLKELARLFRNHCPWVEDVAEVRRSHHNRLSVRLIYRQPVLYLAAHGTPQLYLDRSLVALPPEDVDPNRAGHLLQLVGLKPPFDFLPGSTFETTAAGDHAKVTAALKIATFLFDQMVRDPAPPRIELVDPQWGPHLVEVRTTDRLWVLWGNAPGSERTGEATTAEKWSRLRAWIAQHGPNPPPHCPDKCYLDLTGPRPILRESAGSAESPRP